MKIEKVKISQVKTNPNNPRIIKDNKFKDLVRSIKEAPWMLQLRSIVVNDDNVVIGGNQRLRACKEAGLKEVYIIKASSLTEEQQREFTIKDNVSFGQWDWDMIANEFDSEDLLRYGFTVPTFGNENLLETVNKGDENDEWIGMPEFDVKTERFKIVVTFETEAERQEFAEKHEMQFIKQQKNTWMSRYPYNERDDLTSLKYE